MRHSNITNNVQTLITINDAIHIIMRTTKLI